MIIINGLKGGGFAEADRRGWSYLFHIFAYNSNICMNSIIHYFFWKKFLNGISCKFGYTDLYYLRSILYELHGCLGNV